MVSSVRGFSRLVSGASASISFRATPTAYETAGATGPGTAWPLGLDVAPLVLRGVLGATPEETHIGPATSAGFSGWECHGPGGKDQ